MNCEPFLNSHACESASSRHEFHSLGKNEQPHLPGRRSSAAAEASLQVEEFLQLLAALRVEVLQLRLHTAQPLPQRAAAAAAAVSCLLHRRQPALQLLHLTNTANAGCLRFDRPLRNTAYLRVLFAVPLNGNL